MEAWKDVKGYEGIYKASSFGKIKSLDRTIIRSDGRSCFKKGKILEPVKNADGYLQCKLCKDGKSDTVKVHRVIADTFIENPKNYPEVNHKDCNRQNNRADNLEWTDHLSNIRYSSDQGHYSKPFGKENPNYGNTKLKEYFRDNPEERMKLSRPGAQNGKAKKIRFITPSCTIDFDYIGACAQYLLDNGIIKDVTSKSLTATISLRAKSGKPYKKIYYFQFI